jgi:hypothetical protein
MRGPIDYIIVGFEGKKFDGKILKALSDALDSGVIGLVALSVISRDKDDNIMMLDVTEVDDGFALDFLKSHKPEKLSVDQEDIDEVADLIAENTTAGLLVVEQLWAKPLKQAILDAKGVLLAEGRIHPEAAAELK